MKIAVIGANGFIGSSVSTELEANGHTVTKASYRKGEGVILLDALDYVLVEDFLKEHSPEIVINCAGIVQNNDSAAANVEITMNLLKASLALESPPKRYIISGSAAEYGTVESLPVSERAKAQPTTVYGAYKAKETSSALYFGEQHSLDVIVLRIFNPIGDAMPSRLLIPSVLQQIKEGKREVTVTRADALRDYIDVRDIARAFRMVAEAETLRSKIYNVGSGTATTNRQLIAFIAEALHITMPVIKEAATETEKQLASQADIERISNELNWLPQHDLRQAIVEIVKT